MSRIDKTTLKQQAYNIIKSKILSQSYRLGEKIIIDNLSRELDISNSPIREALTMLERDGLVITNPNAGTSVVELSLSEIQELNETIQILLIGGYDLCVAQGKIDELVASMGERLAMQRQFLKLGDYYNAIKCAIEFDSCLIDVTNNKRLILLYNSLSDILFLAVIFDQQTRDIDRTKNVHDHEVILEAIISGNHDEVKKLIIYHFNKG